MLPHTSLFLAAFLLMNQQIYILLSRVILLWVLIHSCRLIYAFIKRYCLSNSSQHQNHRDTYPLPIYSPANQTTLQNDQSHPVYVFGADEQPQPLQSSYKYKSPYGLEVGIISITLFSARFNRWFKWAGETYARILRIWFGLGAVYGIIAMIVAVILISYSSMLSVHHVYLNLSTHQSSIQSNPLPSPPPSANSSTQSENLSTISPSSAHEPVFTAMIPGVNLPISHVAYYFFALLLNAILHESGHALAAVTAGVPVNGFGVFLMLIYPGAFVELREDSLTKTSTRRQLWIYCAGVWHNAVIAVMAILSLAVLPLLLYPLYHHTSSPSSYSSMFPSNPFYSAPGLDKADAPRWPGYPSSEHVQRVLTVARRGGGIRMVHADENHPLYSALPVGTRIVGINRGECVVNDFADWHTCLTSMSASRAASAPQGYCVPKESTALGSVIPIDGKASEDVMPYSALLSRCLEMEVQRSSRPPDPPIEADRSNPDGVVRSGEKDGLKARESLLPFRISDSEGSKAGEGVYRYTCLPVRRLILPAINSTSNSQAHVIVQPTRCSASHPCPTNNDMCAVLVRSNPFEHLISIQTAPPAPSSAQNHHEQPPSSPQQRPIADLLFLGNPLELLYTLTVSDYEPRMQWTGYALPVRLATFLRYLITLSLALSVLNSVPAYHMDGHQAARCCIRYYIRDQVRTERITNAVVGLSTAMLAVLVLTSVLVEFV